MFLRIIFSGLTLFVDYAFGNCGSCQTNHVACHNEDTFSLCVEGKLTETVIRCPEGKICSSDKDVCIRKDNGQNKPSCVAGCSSVCGSKGRVFSCVGKKDFEFCFREDQPFVRSRGSCLEGYVCDNTQSQICVPETDSKPSCEYEPIKSQDEFGRTPSNGGNYYDNMNAPSTEFTITTPESTELQKNATFSPTKDSKTKFSTNADVSNKVTSGITSDSSSTPSQKSETPSLTEISFTSIETSTKEEVISLVTAGSSTTESLEGALYSSSQDPHTRESISLSTQDLPSSDFSADGVESTTHYLRNAKTFCSENREIGTFKVEGDSTSKRYFICTTYKGVFKGYEYNCGSNNFNSETKICQAEILGKNNLES